MTAALGEAISTESDLEERIYDRNWLMAVHEVGRDGTREDAMEANGGVGTDWNPQGSGICIVSHGMKP